MRAAASLHRKQVKYERIFSDVIVRTRLQIFSNLSYQQLFDRDIIAILWLLKDAESSCWYINVRPTYGCTRTRFAKQRDIPNNGSTVVVLLGYFVTTRENRWYAVRR